MVWKNILLQVIAYDNDNQILYAVIGAYLYINDNDRWKMSTGN